MIKVMKKMSMKAAFMAVLFMVVQVVADLYLPTLTSNIINKGVAKGDVDYIWHIGFIMVGFSLVSIVASVGNTFFATRESQIVGKKLRSEIYHKVENYSLNSFDKFGTASLITRTTNDVTQIQMVLQMSLRMMINAPITLIGASFMSYQKDQHLTRIFLVVLPILALVMGGVMYFAVPLFKSMQKKTDRLNLVFREGLTGVRVIRAFDKGDHEADRFKEANWDYTHVAIKVQTIMAVMMPLMTLIMSGTQIAIVWFGGHYIADMEMEVGNMVAFMTYAMQILMSFMMLAMIFVFIPRAQASAERINEVLDLENDVKDTVENKSLAPKGNQATLAFNHVDFRYHGAERLALTDIDFEGKSGEVIAIIGGTGAGKSTLINLIPRFYNIEKGQILFNGEDIATLNQKSLRDNIGFVPQKAVLFSGTIRSNMQYGNPDVSDEEIWRVLGIAQAKDFVAALPDGLDAVVEQGGDNFSGGQTLPDGLDAVVEQGGDNFSGGQKQRLAIARALIKPSDVYVFDDSFSALDFKTDAKLRLALKENVKDAILIVVAQRVSTVMDADTILVIDEGKQVGKGTHQELMATNETYQEIVHSQLKEDEI